VSEGLTFDDYNNQTREVLTDFAATLVKRGYSIGIFSLGDPSGASYYNSLEQKLSTEDFKHVRQYGQYSPPDLGVSHATYLKVLSENLSIFKESFCTIGVRLHANALSNGLGVPALNIAYCLKGINYSIGCGLQDYCLPTFSKYLTVENLTDRFDKIEKNHNSIKCTLKQVKKECLESYTSEVTKFLKKLPKAISGAAPIIRYRRGRGGHKTVDPSYHFNIIEIFVDPEDPFTEL
jgi:hypothetical protein